MIGDEGNEVAQVAIIETPAKYYLTRFISIHIFYTYKHHFFLTPNIPNIF